MKSKSYAPGKKIWLNSKYIKTKRNCKQEVKFFWFFKVLYAIKKQADKLELSEKWRIHNVFHISPLKQDITSKGQVKTAIELNKGKKKESEVEAICDNAVYAKETKDHLPDLYYLVSCKDYSEEENTWKPVLAIQHL